MPEILWISEVPAGTFSVEFLASSKSIHFLSQLDRYDLVDPTQLLILIQHQNSA
jgi:hypothetical protein